MNLTAEEKAKLSNMMRHYLSIKAKHEDCIIFYRLGDFYEMFFDDAEKVSKLLELTLTGRECGLDRRAPMCGIPYHAADGYIARLVELGEKIAICEQVSDPHNKAKASELVERDVIRIISAGTVTADSMLDEKKNNYIASVNKAESVVAIAWAEITTGEFCAAKFDGDDGAQRAIDYLVNLSPSEILCNDEMLLASRNFNEVKHHLLPHFSSYVAWAFNFKHAESVLCEQFHTISLAAYGINTCEEVVGAAGALLEYLKETQKHALKNIGSIKYVRNEKNMCLDSIAVRNLELLKSNSEGKKYGSLLWLLDRTSTGMGARLLSRLIVTPLHEKEEIEYRLDGVEELYLGSLVRMSLAENLKEMRDLERLAGKISNDNLTPKDCLSLCESLNLLPSIKFQLSGFSSGILKEINSQITDQKEIADLLTRAIDPDASATMKDGGYIRKGYNRELDEYRELKEHSAEALHRMAYEEQQATGIAKLKIGFNNVFNYFIEVPNSAKELVPDRYIRRQTLVNAERYITPELKELEEKILNAQENVLRLESRLYAEIKSVLAAEIEHFKQTARAIAMLDCLIAFATIAKENKYCRPRIADGGEELSIVDGRHPVIEAISREKFVPNDTSLNRENCTMIITGPNMAGKSTYMRQVALIVLMAHVGSFVPAAKAQIPVTDRIFTRVGASDNLIYNQSTFMVEMTEVANILLHATSNSLLILDEVGRGTSTYDGLSIAWAVVEYLTKNIGAKTLFATHYHELTELEGILAGVKNYKVTVREINGSIVFLRKIQQGGANKSFGVEVAALAGIPKDVTLRAKQILKSLEKNDINQSAISDLSDLSDYSEEDVQELYAPSEVERILSETDVNTLSPVQALLLLADLKEKITK